MSEWSAHWTTDAVSPEGHQQASYSQVDNSRIQKIIASCNGYEGVSSILNQLEGTVTGANTVAINTGRALVDGKVYRNNASLDVNIPSSGGGTTRIDRIVLRANWSAFTVLITRIAGTESAGAPAAPAITQTSETTYDITLYQALVDSSGTVTLTDERVMAATSVAYRQGGSATDWATPGGNNYVPGKTIKQKGAGISGESGLCTITFPVPFSYPPIISITAFAAMPGGYLLLTSTQPLTVTSTQITTISVGAGDVPGSGIIFHWEAEGPVA